MISFRVLVLYVLNYITFIIALFEKLDKIRDDELMKIINEQNAVVRIFNFNLIFYSIISRNNFHAISVRYFITLHNSFCIKSIKIFHQFYLSNFYNMYIAVSFQFLHSKK